MQLDRAILEARRIRRNLVRSNGDAELGGECAIASLLLADALGGPESLRLTACTYQRHCWNVVDGMIIDITATQFNEAGRADNVHGVLITRLPMPYHRPVLTQGSRAARVIEELFTCDSPCSPSCLRSRRIVRRLLA